MNGLQRRLATMTVVLGVGGLLSWAFIEGRAELEKERDREKPIQVPPRIKQIADGETIVTFDQETLVLAHIGTTRVSTIQEKVLIPRSSILRHEGKDWVYLLRAPGEFVKRPVDLVTPLATGWLISKGIEANSVVVSVGAQTLLSEELKSQIQVLGEENAGK